jgi:hypothetical protein
VFHPMMIGHTDSVYTTQLTCLDHKRSYKGTINLMITKLTIAPANIYLAKPWNDPKQLGVFGLLDSFHQNNERFIDLFAQY